MIYLGNSPVGVVALKGVGKITKYQELTVTPSSQTMQFTHSLGVVPKLVLITSDSETANKIKNIILSTDANTGAAKYSAGTAGNQSGFYTISDDPEENANACAYCGADKIRIKYIASSRQFDTTATYTAEIYA